jgi:hypothetical protein
MGAECHSMQFYRLKAMMTLKNSIIGATTLSITTFRVTALSVQTLSKMF